MALEPLRIIKQWFANSPNIERCWDEIADKVSAFSSRVNNNFKQIGTDVFGVTYDFNNTGQTTQSTSIASRISTLENATPTTSLGVKNIGLDLASTAIVKICQADGSALSVTNPATAAFNDKANPGEIVSRTISAAMQLTLTGCHWGFDTGGDLTDQKLYISLIDDNGTVILGVDITGGRKTVTPADAETVASSVNTAAKVYVTSEPSAESNCVYIGWINADFDDTGNAGGENYWTLQTGAGDINVGRGESDPLTLTIETVNGTPNFTDNTTFQKNVVLGDSAADITTVSGELQGARCALSYAGSISASSGDAYEISSTAASEVGFCMPRAGSIVGFSAGVLFNTVASTQVNEYQVRKNGVSKLTATVTISAINTYYSAYSTAARNTHTFAAGDAVSIYRNVTTAGGLNGGSGCFVIEVQFDA